MAVRKTGIETPRVLKLIVKRENQFAGFMAV